LQKSTIEERQHIFSLRLGLFPLGGK
jgi:hypothetical protein